MFARIAALGALGALALLMTAPAAQALPEPACVLPGYATSPYGGVVATVEGKLDALAACTYRTHVAPPLPEAKVQLVPDLSALFPEPQTMPGIPNKQPPGEPGEAHDDGIVIPMPFPIEQPVCAQVWPYSAVCAVTGAVVEFVF